MGESVTFREWVGVIGAAAIGPAFITLGYAAPRLIFGNSSAGAAVAGHKTRSPVEIFDYRRVARLSSGAHALFAGVLNYSYQHTQPKSLELRP